MTNGDRRGRGLSRAGQPRPDVSRRDLRLHDHDPAGDDAGDPGGAGHRADRRGAHRDRRRRQRSSTSAPEEGRSGRGIRTPFVGRIEFNEVTFRYPGATAPALDRVSFTIPEGTRLRHRRPQRLGQDDGDPAAAGAAQRLPRADQDRRQRSARDRRRPSALEPRRRAAGEFPVPRLDPRDDRRRQARCDVRGGRRRRRGWPAPRNSSSGCRAGYETFIQEGSTNLSGGQRQRLAIARALMGNPRILMLDEATSALDADSEAIVNANLLRIAQGRTLIIISHRLSALVAADSILVLERGAVYDIGRTTSCSSAATSTPGCGTCSTGISTPGPHRMKSFRSDRALRSDAAARQGRPAVSIGNRGDPRGARTARRALHGLCARRRFSSRLIVLSLVTRLDRVVTSVSGQIVTTQPTIVVAGARSRRSSRRSMSTRAQRVKAGDVLATLDPTFAAADVDALKLQIASLDAQIARCEAELARSPVRRRRAARIRRPPATQQLQKSYYLQRKAQFDSQIHAYDEQIAQTKATIAKLSKRSGALRRPRQARQGSRADARDPGRGRRSAAASICWRRPTRKPSCCATSNSITTAWSRASISCRRRSRPATPSSSNGCGEASQELVTARNQRDAARAAAGKGDEAQGPRAPGRARGRGRAEDGQAVGRLGAEGGRPAHLPGAAALAGRSRGAYRWRAMSGSSAPATR